MGKRDKKQKHSLRNSRRGTFNYCEDEDDGWSGQLDATFSSSSKLSHSDEEEESEEEVSDNDNQQQSEGEKGRDNENPSTDIPSKFHLYQQSVQSPKGDISYLQKFFMMYVGGRLPLHLQEDFCGTALLSTEWLRGDPRRTAIGLDLDLEALNWCMDNNMTKVGADGYNRLSLFHGNVLQPHDSKIVKIELDDLIRNLTLKEAGEGSQQDVPEATVQNGFVSLTDDSCLKRNFVLPARDIVCAFNYSCCCLHRRADLVLYFKHVHDTLSKKGGIFAMDLYGGTSSERKLKLQRRFPDFTYEWEQAEFDIVERKTRISLHFHLRGLHKKLRHAFSYSWRLWTLPEIRDCLEEAGFQSVYFWLRQMPDTVEFKKTDGLGSGWDVKYEEVKKFEQQDAWNAYIVGVA